MNSIHTHARQQPGSSSIIGPNGFYCFGALLASPLAWLAAIEATIHHSITVRTFLWKIAAGVRCDSAILQTFVWLKSQPVAPWIWLLGLAALHALIRYATSSYRITADGNLVVSTGWLGMGAPGGPFQSFDDTVAGALIVDVNVSRNFIQLLCGTGTIIVSFTEYSGRTTFTRKLRLPYVNQPKKHAEAIMALGGVNAARYYV